MADEKRTEKDEAQYRAKDANQGGDKDAATGGDMAAKTGESSKTGEMAGKDTGKEAGQSKEGKQAPDEYKTKTPEREVEAPQAKPGGTQAPVVNKAENPAQQQKR